MWGFLAEYLSLRVVVGLGAVVVLLRFRRYKAVGGAAVGAASSAATTAVAVVVALFGIVALGYWEPPVSEIVGDVLGSGRALYDSVGEWLLDNLIRWLDSVAA